MAGKSKRAQILRTRSEFDLVRLVAEMRSPKVSSGNYAWDLDAIRAARDAQMRGQFKLPVRLAESTRTDYAIYASFVNRLAPQHGLPVAMRAANDTARAKRVRDEAEALFGKKGVGIHPDTLADIDGTLADHGIAIAYNVLTPRADGSRVDLEMKSWPLEFVTWDSTRKVLRTQTSDGEYEDIVHGDGRWVVFQQHERSPWKYGAIISTGMLWADHAFGVRDRSRAGTSHGNAKILGELPAGIPLEDADGNPTPEALALVTLMRDVASVDTMVGIKPSGAKLDAVVNNSTAWQIFKEIIDSGDRAADRIYLGTGVDAKSVGGDAVSYLFGVRNDIVEGSLRAIERGIRTGSIDVWTAINFGDSTVAPERVYLMPDPDEDARRKSFGERMSMFLGAIKATREAGFVVTPEYVQRLAEEYGVPVPAIATASTSSQSGEASATTPAPAGS